MTTCLCTCGHANWQHSAGGCAECACKRTDDAVDVACLRTTVEYLRGALADIAFSSDVTLKAARAKAKRVYEETRT